MVSEIRKVLVWFYKMTFSYELKIKVGNIKFLVKFERVRKVKVIV